MRSFRSPGAALHQTRLERNAEGAMAVPEARPGEADPVSLGHRGGIEAQPLAFEGPMDGDREIGVDEGVAGMVEHHGERSEEHTSESSHLVISYAVFCLKKKKKRN